MRQLMNNVISRSAKTIMNFIILNVRYFHLQMYVILDNGIVIVPFKQVNQAIDGGYDEYFNGHGRKKSSNFRVYGRSDSEQQQHYFMPALIRSQCDENFLAQYQCTMQHLIWDAFKLFIGVHCNLRTEHFLSHR